MKTIKILLATAIVVVVVVGAELTRKVSSMQATVDNANKLLKASQAENERLRNKLLQYAATMSAHRNVPAGDVLKMLAGTE